MHLSSISSDSWIATRSGSSTLLVKTFWPSSFRTSPNESRWPPRSDCCMTKFTPFSKRQGYASRELIREGAPEYLRHFTFQTVKDSGLEPYQAREMVCELLHKRPSSAMLNNWQVWEETRHLLESCEWYYVYDILEAVALYWTDASDARQGQKAGVAFEHVVNDVLEHECIGWQMKGGLLVYRGEEAFEAAVETAKSALGSASKNTAKEEIDKALEDLSKRPVPDLTGAVHHAIAALECVAKD